MPDGVAVTNRSAEHWTQLEAVGPLTSLATGIVPVYRVAAGADSPRPVTR